MDQLRAPHKIIIDIRPMKEKCLIFPEPLRTLILEEPSKINVEEFIEKMSTWERLLKIIENGRDMP
ncbi:MAG: hypothetical protein ACP5UZ_08720 [Thermoplasmata archaeon]